MRRISELSRRQLRNVFTHEDLLFRLTEGQLAALGERQMYFDQQDRKSFWEWFITLGDVPEEDGSR